jgi:hypothetical protein
VWFVDTAAGCVNTQHDCPVLFLAHLWREHEVVVAAHQVPVLANRQRVLGGHIQRLQRGGEHEVTNWGVGSCAARPGTAVKLLWPAVNSALDGENRALFRPIKGHSKPAVAEPRPVPQNISSNSPGSVQIAQQVPKPGGSPPAGPSSRRASPRSAAAPTASHATPPSPPPGVASSVALGISAQACGLLGPGRMRTLPRPY